MSLVPYKKKRNFKTTSEPESTETGTEPALVFVVQKHAASHLHYDLRLEMGGVLKSWAVPKGPSLNPEDKHLAVMVEDHPYAYKNFEGTIPAGNYGAGKVIVWDTGTCHALHATGKQNEEKELLDGLKKGHISFILKGKKLNGEFALVKLKNSKQPNAWLLMKKHDAYATTDNVLTNNKSAISNLVLESVISNTTAGKPVVNNTGNYNLKLGRITLKLTNQDKIYWPGDNITKGELVNYYSQMAQLILPYLKNRPESLHRFPGGINAPGFYQKDLDIKTSPHWLKTEKILSASTGKNTDYLICNNRASLLYMANLGCIEIHPWNSRITAIDKPDWMVIDLDPEDIGFDAVIKTALTTQKICNGFELDCYCKTSGATGLHIFIPLGARYSYDIVHKAAFVLAQKIHASLPAITSLERLPKKRQQKVYPDYLQNSRGQTLAAPYSVRPRPGATVSTPLEWSEVNSKLNPSLFTIKTIFKRIDKKGDLWKPVSGKGSDLKKLLSAMPG